MVVVLTVSSSSVYCSDPEMWLWLLRQVDSDKFVNVSTSAKSSQDEKRPAVQEPYRLPPEFHHFYHGSQVDMGALIEVSQIKYISQIWSSNTCEHIIYFTCHGRLFDA